MIKKILSTKMAETLIIYCWGSAIILLAIIMIAKTGESLLKWQWGI